MARYTGPKCKLERREGERLFLKGERCASSKCGVVRRPFAPGVHGPAQAAKGGAKLSGFGKQLREKQKAKRIYGIMERQFKNYVKRATQQKGDTGEILKQMLELRLDNVVYRLGLAKSRAQARQLVTHGHILVNGKKVNVPSYMVRPNEEVSVKPNKLKSPYFEQIRPYLENYEPSAWLHFNKETMAGRVLSRPQGTDLPSSYAVKPIIEYYSR